MENKQWNIGVLEYWVVFFPITPIIFKREAKMKKVSHSIIAVMIVLGIIALSVPALASDIGSPDPEVIKGLYPGKTYSPMPSVFSPVGCTGVRHTSTPGCRLMPGCSALPRTTRMPID
jgi:hypothetical protein